MNAEDSATPATGLYNPPARGAEAEAVSAQTPRRSAFRPVTQSQAPTAGTAPTTPASAPRSGAFTFSPTSTASATPASAGAAATGAAATTAAPTRPATPTEAPAGGHASEGAFTVGAEKVKGFAVRAKKSLTEGDDLSASKNRGGPRKARVLVSRVDPWSVLKMGFLLSVALGIMTVVAVFVLWNALNEFGLFALIDTWVGKLFDGEQPIDIAAIFELNKVMSAAVLVSVVNVVLLTALSTIAAFLYNTVSSVVGGVYVTLTDD